MRISGWFRALFTIIMLALCCTACWYCLSTTSLNATMTDLETKFTTSRQRETKQQMEYDAVCVALPDAKAALAALQPQADAAKSVENELRAQRKQLRNDIAALKEVLPAVEQVNASLRQIVTETQALLTSMYHADPTDD